MSRASCDLRLSSVRVLALTQCLIIAQYVLAVSGVQRNSELGFVRIRNGQFVESRTEAPVRALGANVYWLRYSLLGNEQERERVEVTLDAMQNLGLDVVRTWAFMDGDDESFDGRAMQPREGVFNEKAFVGLDQLLKSAVETVENNQKAVVFGSYVKDPERYGVAEFDASQNVVSIEEKPKSPKSNYAVVGLYFYPNSVIDIAKTIKPSDRGELEITSVNVNYLKKGQLKMEVLKRGFAWLDTGTHEALSEATEFVKAVEKRTGLKIACLEEIALNYGWISKEKIIQKVQNLKGDYYEYLKNISK